MIAAVALIIMTVAPTFAAASDFTRYELTATAHKDGTVDVVIDLDYDFGSEEKHGIYLTYLTRQRIEGDPDHYRVLEYSGITASSPSAPADTDVVEADDGIGIYVGDPDQTVTGEHTYEVAFTVDGLINPAAGSSGEDEIYWNVIGHGYEELISEASVTLSGPGPVLESECWYGDEGSEAPCSSTEVDGARAVFAQTTLTPGEGLTIATSYEAGTFAGVEAILTKRATFTNTMGGLSLAAIAAAGSALLAALAPRAISLIRRDRRYANTTPGLIPPGGEVAPTEPAPRKIDPAVQFTPPEGLTPADVGLIVDAKADPRFHAATIVDLAVRGYLHITTKGSKTKSSWEITREHEDTAGLSPYENDLLAALFAAGSTVELGKLPAESAKMLARVNKEQATRLASAGWFTSPPATATASARGIGVAVMTLGVISTIGLAFAGYGLLGLIGVVAGIAIIATGRRAARRSARGHAHYVQALGFKKYLETAQGRQLRFEAGEDIFSRYLPYAMVLGVVDTWVAVFEDLHAGGEWTYVPTWYTGLAVGAAPFSSPSESAAFRSNATQLQSVAALVAMGGATAGSSGGSAFSGSGGGFSGGGFSGGGVGGGGGGSW